MVTLAAGEHSERRSHSPKDVNPESLGLRGVIRTGGWPTLLVGPTWPLSVNKVWLERKPCQWDRVAALRWPGGGAGGGQLRSYDRDRDGAHLVLDRTRLLRLVL